MSIPFLLIIHIFCIFLSFIKICLYFLGPLQVKPENDIYHYNNRMNGKNPDPSQTDKQRQLFNWGDNDDKHTSVQGVYGDGPRRLPLINGIWPPQDQKEQVLAFGIQSTPGPKIMMKEEIDIAELRQKQLEELKKERHTKKGNWIRTCEIIKVEKHFMDNISIYF